MKNSLSSIAVLVLSFIAGPQTLGAVVDQTDADVFPRRRCTSIFLRRKLTKHSSRYLT
jgi:hypothetical protein